MASLNLVQDPIPDSRILRLDGVRALAVGLVFANHGASLKIGWVGVPLFFVLSGMLITRILRRERNAGSFWAPFYMKRATRILPPLIIAFVAGAICFPIPWKKIGFYEMFFLANVAEAIYPHASRSLGILWSLAVEEQFYFVWPFAIRFLNRGQLIRLLVGLLTLEPILRAFATPLFTTFWPIFFLTPFQLDGLAAGSLIALLLEEPIPKGRMTRWSGTVCAGAIGIFAALSFLPGFHRESNSTNFNSLGYSLVTLASASFIVYVLLHKEGALSRALSHPFVTFFGTISYGLYLFHLFAIMMARQIGRSQGYAHLQYTSGFALVAVTLFSWLSFRFYEQPITRWGRRKAAARNHDEVARVPPKHIIAELTAIRAD